MAKTIAKYVCQQCGYSQVGWAGRCPNCQTWGSLVETIEVIKTITKQGKNTQRQPIELVKVKEASLRRISTGILECDLVLGGGLVPGQVVLIAGEPGIGKSTLISQIAEKIYPPRPTSGRVEAGSKVKEKNVLYIAGEESTSQIKLRSKRLGLRGINIFILEETDVDQVVEVIGQQPNTLILVDSIQTLTTTDLSGTAGSIGQVRESATRLVSISKKLNIPLFLVGHVTKEGAIAGPRVLEHMVDTILWFEGERTQQLRILRTIKNRFGPTDEIGIFTMEDKGLVPVKDPEFAFTSGIKNVPGQIWTVILEGTRPIVVEIQALVVPTKLGFPRRVVQGVDQRRVDLLLAVLGRRAGLPLQDFDIFVNAVGGINVREPAADLAIALAIASSWANKSLGDKIAAFGEVGLLGEVRSVPQAEQRAKEANRLGKRLVVSYENTKTIGEAIRKLIK